MHVPRPQHGLSHGCAGGGAAHWSPSATRGKEGITGVRRPRPRPPSGPETSRGTGTAARGLERTHRGTWTRRPSAERRGGVRGPQPTYVNGEPRGPSPGWPRSDRQHLSGQGREGLPHKEGSTPASGQLHPEKGQAPRPSAHLHPTSHTRPPSPARAAGSVLWALAATTAASAKEGTPIPTSPQGALPASSSIPPGAGRLVFP